MPRPNKGAGLEAATPVSREERLIAQAVWIIKDGGRHIATGCLASPTETKPPKAAEQAFSRLYCEEVSTGAPSGGTSRRLTAPTCYRSTWLTPAKRATSSMTWNSRIGRLNELLGRQGPRRRELAGVRRVREASRQQGRIPSRPRNPSGRHQPPRQSRVSPRHRTGISATQRRTARPLAHAR